MGRRPPRRSRAPAVLLALAVPGLLASFTQLPTTTDRPVTSVELPPDYDALLVFFGYVDCPQICPTTLVRLEQIYDAASRPGLDLGVVFVNLTPAEPGVAARYAKAFHPDFEGVQADLRDRGALMRELGVRFDRDDDSPAGWHTDSTYVLQRSEDGWRLRAVVPRPRLRPETIHEILEGLETRNDQT